MAYKYGTSSEFELEMQALNNKFAVGSLGGHTVVVEHNGVDFNGRRCYSFKKVEEFKSFWSHEVWIVEYSNKNGTESKQMNLMHQWLKYPDRKTYTAIVFCPGETMPEDYLNLWQGFAIKPQAGDCSLFWDHMLDVICFGDGDAFQYLLNYMAHMVQKVGELPEVALVFRGQQGIGKDLFVSAIAKIFGNHFMALSSMEDVAGRFNGPMMDKLVIHANEAIWGGDKKSEGALKTLITDKTRKYESKGKDMIQGNNYTRLLVTSNNDWVVPLDMDDRRYCFFNVTSQYKGNTEYFSKLYAELNNGGYEAILHELLAVDIAGFHPRVRPQCLVSNGIDQVYKRMNTIENFIEESLQTGVLSNYLDPCRKYPNARSVRFNSLYDEFEEYCEQQRVQHRPSSRDFSHKVFGFKQKPGLLPNNGKYQQVDRAGAGKVLCYSIGSLEQCRSYFEQTVMGGRKVDWDDQSEINRELEYDDTPNVTPLRGNPSPDSREQRLESTQKFLADRKEHRRERKNSERRE
jgi:phage/plasmid-associated DNA primase